MESRFATISYAEVKELKEKLENENTKKKTLYDISVLYLQTIWQVGLVSIYCALLPFRDRTVRNSICVFIATVCSR